MRTDELIDLLGRGVARVDPCAFPRRLRVSIAVGAGGALPAALLALGPRRDLHDPEALSFVLLKLAFTVSVAAVAFLLLSRLVRPGGEHKARVPLAILPFGAMGLLGTFSLALAPAAHWEEMLVGDRWLQCLLFIPLTAMMPFAVIMWTVRRFAAPTALVRTGAVIGLVSGSVSAMGYALHCPDDSLPFVALWYGGTIVLCTVVGALFGPYLLRWR